jgi:hypothetical protein
MHIKYAQISSAKLITLANQKKIKKIISNKKLKKLKKNK